MPKISHVSGYLDLFTPLAHFFLRMHYLANAFILTLFCHKCVLLAVRFSVNASEYIEKYDEFELCSKYDREQDFDVILGSIILVAS